MQELVAVVVEQFDAVNILVEDYNVFANFEGYGPTFALEMNRPLRGNLSWIAGTRHSVLYGESDVRVVELGGNDFDMLDRKSGMYIAEVQTGVQYTRCLGRAEMVLRGVWEAQYWAGMPLATRMGENFSDSDELFMDGFSFALGFNY